MNNTNCHDCSYWKREAEPGSTWVDEIVQPTDEDTYEPKAMPFEARYCHSPKLVRFERPLEADGASCIDGSNYIARLATGPMFGCVNHRCKYADIYDVAQNQELDA